MNLGRALLTPTPPAGIWLLCGPPASGKSTFRRFWWHGPVVSPDELRQQMLGVAHDPRREGAIWARVHRDIGRHLKTGSGLLLDATNVRRRDRKRWVDAAGAAGVPAFAIACWDPDIVPLEELLRRNAARPRQVPEEALSNLARAWEPPARAEGFAAVWTVVPSGAGATADSRLAPTGARL